MKKVILTIVTVCLVLAGLILCFVSFLGLLEEPPSNSQTIMQGYTSNKELFNELVDYIQKNSANISVDKDENGKIIVSQLQDSGISNLNMEDNQVNEDIKDLFDKLKYYSISEEDGKIKFIRSTGLRYDEGLLYCKGGTVTTNQYYEEIEHIEGNWYYYKYTD